jgi:hypothetical protein
LSHLKERKEKTCLNCNAFVQGRFCHICGQENIETGESAWHLINHFFQDITHFDGRFFTSIRQVIFKPGFLPREYMNGRRASHLNPVRMYIFTSAFFFLIFFSVFKFNSADVIKIDNGVSNVKENLRKMTAAEYKSFIAAIVDKDSSMKFAYDTAKYFSYLDTAAQHEIRFTPSNYKTLQEYETAIAKGKDHNWFEKMMVRRQFALNEKFKGDGKAIINALNERVLHALPQILFITLPLFALLLKLLYIRRKQFYYVNHAIFTLHLFIFVFIALLAIFGLNKLVENYNWQWLNYVSGILGIAIYFYNYKAMRNFYQQGRAKTVIKFILLHLMNFFIAAFVFIAFFMVSLFNV